MGIYYKENVGIGNLIIRYFILEYFKSYWTFFRWRRDSFIYF